MTTYVFEDVLYISEAKGSITNILLSFHLPLKSIRHRIQTGLIKVNQETVSFDHDVSLFDVISVDLFETCQYEPSGKYPCIVYEDDHYLIVNKPEGQVVHDDHNSLCHDVATYLNHRVIRFAGRLDIDTSGLMLFYKHFVASSATDELMMKHQIDKTYLTIVEGQVNKCGTIQLPIGKDRHSNKQRISQTGVLATTHYKVLNSSKKRSLLQVTIETGRKHQIRVHMQAIGHPIVGDVLYGKKANRMALHCFRLSFKDPFSHQTIDVKQDPSISFYALLNS